MVSRKLRALNDQHVILFKLGRIPRKSVNKVAVDLVAVMIDSFYVCRWPLLMNTFKERQGGIWRERE